ncbi:RagB/SusD family nutrient uptake outer membrane protein [termite gut metagenome]|uniref:RagB/SusD family nutrient uptake outer membrane protein n=1 Tax=termite gut metagenome TaxID=433724 RepID=A0A5J4QXY3_9ZZZZ
MPLYLTAHNTPSEIEEALTIGRSSVEETYAQIIKDLDEAEALFSGNGLNAVNGISRVSKGSVIALKTRVYLHKRDWSNVIKEASKLTDEATSAPFKSPIGGYALTASPATPFTSYANNTESVFSIENNSDDNGSVNGAMAAMMSCRTGGRAIVTSSPTIYNTKYWLNDDKRRGLLLYRASDQYYFCDKYQDVPGRSEWAPIIRYAEVLLNYSEAALRSGNKTLALELFNAVRNRSLADPATQAYQALDFATDKDFLEALLWERRIEFHGEGRRWEDIHRLAADDLCPSEGIPAKIDYDNVKGKGAFVVNGEVKEEWYSASRKFIPYTDKRFVWPIPVNDLIRNPTLAGQQNSGW